MNRDGFASVVLGSEKLTKISSTYFAFYAEIVNKHIQQPEGVSVDSGVSEQPTSYEETVQGATNRSINALAASADGGDFGVGIEGGVYEENGVMKVFDVVAITIILEDGLETFVGQSSGYELPVEVANQLRTTRRPLSKVMSEYLTVGEFVVTEQAVQDNGTVFYLTDGQVNRRQVLNEAFTNAFAQMDLFFTELNS